MHPLPRAVAIAGTLGFLLVGCRPTVINDILTGVAKGVETATGNGTGTLIRAKRTSSLSQDASTVTLAIDAAAPGGAETIVTWQEVTQLGTLNTDRGANVQWAAKGGISGTAVIRVTAQSGSLSDSAEIRLPVNGGKIKPAELTPEVSVAPQSATLFRPLPPSLGLSEDQLLVLGAPSKVILGATTFRYDAATNDKVKKPYDPAEIRWQSADPDLLVVSESGAVRPSGGSKVGEAAIVAVSKTDSSQRASALVRVRYLATKIDLIFDRTSLAAGSTLPLAANVTYTNPDDRGRVIKADPASKDVTWESSDKTKAQVDLTGTVKALADAVAGSTVTITGRSAYDPSVAETLTLTIRPST